MLIGIDASRAFVKDKTGTENYSYELIKAILELSEAKKHTFRLYVRDGQKVPIYDEDRNQGEFGTTSYKGYEPLYKNVEWVEIGWPRLWTQGGLAIECLKRLVDVLWVPAHTLPVIRRKSMKTVVTIHGLEYEYLPEYNKFPQSLYLNKSTEYAVKRADKIIAVSKWTKKQLVDRLGADEKKIKVIYEGIGRRFVNKQGSELTRGVRNRYNLPKKYVLFVGTIQPRKNLVRLVEAWAGVVSGYPLGSGPAIRQERTLNLVIAGKKGWMHDEIYKAPAKYGVEDRVKFIGRVADEDLAAVYGGASLFVWPSLMEGFGLPLLEAMQMGVPVVCSDRGALPEVAGKAALLVDPEKVGQITEAIELVIANKELREGLVEKGYRQVKKFSWRKAAKETLRILVE